jgi:glyoxylase-like metal-dependent hydrolase (beta-lactamase superfamily II)
MVEVSRRTWIRRLATGAVALTAALNLPGGKEGFGITIGREVPTADAQVIPIEYYRAVAELNFGGGSGIANGFDVQSHILVRGREVTIVDTLVGSNANFDLISQALAGAGRSYSDVVNVVLTHMHPDHTGNLNRVLAQATNATVWAGTLDAPRINSSRPIKTVGEGDDIFGLQVYDTPGHTPGSITLWDPASRTVIAGDAISNRARVISVLTADSDQAQGIASIGKISNLKPDRAFFGHGFPLTSDASATLAAWVLDQRLQRYFRPGGR